MKVKKKMKLGKESFWGVFLFLFIVIQSMTVHAEKTDDKVTLIIETGVLQETGKESYLPLELELQDEKNQTVVLKNNTEEIGEAEYNAGKSGKYEAEVSAGTYYYTAYNPNTHIKMGSGSIEVEGATEQKEYLSIFDWSRSDVITNKDEIEFTIELTGPDGKTKFQMGETGLTAVLPVKVGTNDGAYTYRFVPKNSDYWGSKGKLWVYAHNYVDTFSPLNLSDSQQSGFLIAPKTTIQLEVEKDAQVQIAHLQRFYRPKEYIEGKIVESKETTDIWEFEVPLYDNGTIGGLNYEVRKEGKITQAKNIVISEYAENKKILKVPALKDNPATQKKDSSQGYYQASVLLNGPTSKMVFLKTGETFDIWASRAWQAVVSTTGNYYVDPDFHYTVVEGDSIQVREDGRVTAVKNGVSVVQITYDALEYNVPSTSSDLRDENELMVYSAIWPERTGVLVFNVGDSNTDKISTNIGLTEYDTLYYAKTINSESKDTYAEYTFSPEANGAITVRVQKPLETDWSKGWEEYSATKDGSYKIKLHEGPNIVEVKTENSAIYHVIYAKGLDVKITNESSPNKNYFVVGDTAKITFDGVILPQPKLGAVYNPGYEGGTYIVYEVDGATIQGEHSQWEIQQKNSLSIKLEDEGKVELLNGRIHATTIGEDSKKHQGFTWEGINNNYSESDSAESFNGYLSFLPDIKLDVKSAKDEEEEEKLNSLEIKATLTSAAMSKLENTSNPMIAGKKMGAQYYTIFNKNMGMGKNTYTPTIVIDQAEVPQNMVYWDVTAVKLLPDATGVNYVKLKQPTDNVTMKLRYWSSADGYTTPKILELQDDTLATTEKFVSKNDIGYYELIISPSEGNDIYPKTYTLAAQLKNGTHYGKFAYLYGLEFNVLDGKSDMKVTDGILHADEQEGIDFGYGFLGTETEYTVTVPYTTTKVTLNPTALEESNPVTVTVNGQDVTNKTDSQEIELQGALTEIPVVVTVSGEDGTVYDTKTYTVKVQRAEGPRKVTFEAADGVSILVKNEAGKKQTAEEEGYYLLEKGDYTVTASKLGYLAQTTSFTVGDDPEYTFTIPELTELEKQSGTATVSIAGADTVLLRTSEREIGDPADLAKEKYVEYNYGGYTVLQSLIEAMQDNGIGFSCRKGQLVPDATPTDNQNEEAGWICEINGKVCENPAETLVNDGDAIVYYYSAGYEEMLHASLTPEVKELTRGQTATLYLTATSVKNDGTAGKPVEGARIYEGTELLGTTDENGAVEISSNTMKLGVHFLTAVKKNDSDQNILTSVVSMISVKKPDDASADPNTTTVTFRLIGDTNHGDDQSLHEYTTWIATGTYTFEKEEVTVGEVFETALKEAGLNYSGLENNYISAITAPESCGGYSLAEMSNSPRSGWMYTVNGFHPSEGVAKYYVTTGDEIVFHYVDDYLTEVLDWSSGTQGNASTWNKWLEALDETPGARVKAAAVDEKIAEIGEEISLNDDSEEKIVAARKAYDALTREEKSYVEKYNDLKNAEKSLADLKKAKADREAADAVLQEIQELPDATALVLENREAVSIAGTAYRSLTDDQKILVQTAEKGAIYTKLLAAEGKMAELLGEEAVRLVTTELTNLPDAENVTLEVETKIADASAHYEALTEEQKAEIAETLITKLNNDIEKLNALKEEAAAQEAADEVTKLLNELPSEEEVLLSDQAVIAEAREIYDALESSLAEKVSADAVAKLTAAEEKLQVLQEEVNTVAGLIEALPAVEEISTTNEEQVKEARTVYDALRSDQKRVLTENGTLSRLLLAENQLQWLLKDVDAAKKVTDRIGSLPTVKELKLADKTAVQAARNAYEGLSDEQKQYVSADTLQTLANCEAELQRLEAVTPAPTPDSGTTPTPTPTPDSEASEETVTLTYQNYPISVTGKVSAYDLRLTALKASDDSVKQMQKKISSKEALIRLYDVQMYLNGTAVDWEEPITINFQVGEKYNGKKLTVLHDVDGTIEKLKGTVSDGILSVTANSLSPFGVVVTASTVTASGVTNSDASTATTVTNGNLNGTVGTAANGTSAQALAEGVTGTGTITSAATGDNTDLLLPVAGLITASGALGGVVLYYKKKRGNTGVQTEEDQ